MTSLLSNASLCELLIAGLRDRAVFLTDPQGRITSWNPGVERLLGYSEQEWVGQSAVIIFTPEDVAKGDFEKEIREATLNGQAADVRWHRKKDGGVIFIDGILVALLDDAGSLMGFGKVMRDATEAKRAAEALRRSEERLRFAQEGAQLGIWDWDISSDVVTRSAIHYRLFGQEPRTEPERYAQWLSSVHPDDRAGIEEKTRNAVHTGEMEAEFRVIWPDGSIHWMHAQGKVYFEDGQPRRMVRVVRDITRRKHAEQAHADSEARKAAILSASLDAVLLMDSDGLLQEFNPAAERMFGYQRAEAVGRSLADLIVPPRLREAHKAGLARYLATGKERVLGQRIEIDAMRSDGTEFPVELAILRVPVQGLPLFAGYVRDISDRKRAEDALRRSNEDLGEFAHVVSHDLQGPLRTVRAYTQLLARRFEGQLDEDADELISHVLNGTNTMKVLIEGLLQYATAGEEAPREQVDLGQLVNGVVSSLGALIKETGAEVISEKLPAVSANPVQMQQLFQNLIGNAIKYRRPGGLPHVHLSARRSRLEWEVAVRDNGIGMRPEHAHSIFGVFKRLHGSEIPGAGIGLAICKRIVEKHGGRIWVESEPGRGSTFFFTLPA